MNRLSPCRGGLRSVLANIHPVDKSLLLFMLVLLAQSAYSIFCSGGASQTAGEIDIIVRTSAATVTCTQLAAFSSGEGDSSVCAAPGSAAVPVLSEKPIRAMGPGASVRPSLPVSSLRAAVSAGACPAEAVWRIKLALRK